MKRRIPPEPEAELRRRFPIAGRLPGWFFRVREVSAGAYVVEGRDPYGRSVSRQGGDPDALLERCVADAREVEAGIG